MKLKRFLGSKEKNIPNSHNAHTFTCTVSATTTTMLTQNVNNINEAEKNTNVLSQEQKRSNERAGVKELVCKKENKYS